MIGKICAIIATAAFVKAVTPVCEEALKALQRMEANGQDTSSEALIKHFKADIKSIVLN